MTNANASASKKVNKTLDGVVVSDKMDKTIVVLLERKVRHPKYEKTIVRSSKFHVHDEDNKAKIGDRVLIKQSRPRSKTKSWELVSIVENK
jgi:small subunit ribosomal protein S17